MASKRDDARIEFRATRRPLAGRHAVLVLNGASVAGLSRAYRWARRPGAPPLLVAVDGGLATCRKAGRKPDLYVGDGDSTRKRPRGIESIVFPRDKSFSDLSGALDELRRREVSMVAVAGMLGGRLDHEWANLLELAAHARRFAGIVAPTPRATIAITVEGCRVREVRGRTFSLFALNGKATVTLRGARWELRRHSLQPGSQGLSNRCKTEIDLEVHSGCVALALIPPERT